jgi:hypothetical protein
MMNANNQPAQIPANVGHHQQQGHRNERTSNVIEEILPVHGEEWEDVLLSHAANFPGSHRTSDSLHRKFLQLYRVKKPTGDPFCPPDVRKAKCLCHLITTKCEIDDAEWTRDVSFDDYIVVDETVVENEDDKIGVLREFLPVVETQVAHGNGVLAPLPQSISEIAASCKRSAVRIRATISWRSTS